MRKKNALLIVFLLFSCAGKIPPPESITLESLLSVQTEQELHSKIKSMCESKKLPSDYFSDCFTDGLKYVCKQKQGVWKEFRNSCKNLCKHYNTQNTACLTSVEYGCDCSHLQKCWNGVSCQAI